MKERSKFQVDLADPDDVRDKLAEAEEIMVEKRQEAEYWSEMVTNLKRLAGTDVAVAKRRPAPVQNAVVRIVEEEGRPMRPVEVTRRLREEGREVNNPSINAALYAAAEAGRLRRTAERQYGPRLKKAKKAKKPPRKVTS